MGINLENFLPGTEDHRDYLKEVLHLEGYDVATNGHYAIFQKAKKSSARREEKIVNSLYPYIQKYEATKETLPLEVKDPESIKCEHCEGVGSFDKCYECDGLGVVSWHTSNFDYEADCQLCDGDGAGGFCVHCHGEGKRYKPVHIKEVDGYISFKYWQLFRDFPELRLIKTEDVKEKKEAILFSIQNGFVALMQVRLIEEWA